MRGDTFRARAALSIVLVGIAGCAGLTAKKVSLDRRLEGRDNDRGFRYYLSRPHLVIAQRILVGCDVTQGIIVTKKSPTAGQPCECLIETLEPTEGDVAANGTRFILYDLQGTRLGPKSGEEYTPLQTTTKLDGRVSLEGMLVAGQIRPIAYEDSFYKVDLSRAPFLAPYLPGPNAVATSTTATAVAAATDTATPTPNIQIAWLPDFEEQIAVRHKTFIAQDKFALVFRDGWQLDSVQSSVDNTQVAVKALQVLSTAINQAAAYEQARLQQISKSQGGGGGPQAQAAVATSPGSYIQVAIIHRHYIEPGIYRLTKQGERAAAPPQDCIGLLADLGLPVNTDVCVVSLAKATSAANPNGAGVGGAGATPPVNPNDTHPTGPKRPGSPSPDQAPKGNPTNPGKGAAPQGSTLIDGANVPPVASFAPTDNAASLLGSASVPAPAVAEPGQSGWSPPPRF